MNDFGLWCSTGFEHIADLEAYDHILFVTLLTLAYPLLEWRKLLILITAFTVGHSVSLALSVVNGLNLPTSFIEFLIAFSILITGIVEFIQLKKTDFASGKIIYMMVVLFGLIHGMGFSFLLKEMLGREQSIILPLVYFNLGLELGQVVIVGIVLVFSLFITTIIKWPYTIFKLSLLALITLIALKMCVERFLPLFSV
jgi:hypothetical protein